MVFRLSSRPHSAGVPREGSVRRIITGVNFSVALGNPFRSFRYGEGLEAVLERQRAGSGEPIVFFLHLASPRVSFSDRGKTAVVMSINIANALNDAVVGVTKDWAKQRKAEERNANARFRHADRLVRTDRVTIQEAAFAVMKDAYNVASDNGRLPVKARQVMYAARPRILEMTGKDAIDDAYFTQTLLPVFIDLNPVLCANWDIVWDARGHFQEPHTNLGTPLGTLEVRGYLGFFAKRADLVEISASAFFPTYGPENRFHSVLFIEKEGFGPLFESARLAERFDLAMMSTKGMSPTAARMLLDKLCKRDLKHIFVLHDFDVSGFSIAGTLSTSNDRYTFQNKLPVVDIGLRLKDVAAMGLESELVSVSGDWKKRVVTLRRHRATVDEIEFLKNKRVELNAMTSSQMIEFIESKLAEHGVEKVIPGQDVLEKHARHLLEQRLPRKLSRRCSLKLLNERSR